jgi:hypothetical protein
MKRRSIRWLLLCAMISWIAAGCAATPSLTISNRSEPVVQVPSPETHGWWFVRFRMDPAGETRWEIDLLIAHRVLFPLIGAHGEDIDLWRFHRRSAEDNTGHQFSFLFFTTAQVAGSINQMILADPLVRRMLAVGVIQEVITDPVDHNDHQDVGDTSDPKWSPVMQNTWPYYIMGVSRMWLEMIDQVSQEIGIAGSPTLGQLLAHYQRVNDEVTHIWQHEGYHALLHHLNAIFGYEAMVYWEKRWKAF